MHDEYDGIVIGGVSPGEKVARYARRRQPSSAGMTADGALDSTAGEAQIEPADDIGRVVREHAVAQERRAEALRGEPSGLVAGGS